MAEVGLNINKAALYKFEKDFKEVIRVSVGMGKAYKRGIKKLDKLMKDYTSLISLFNKKYKKITLKISKSVEELRLYIFLEDKGIKELFSNVATKIPGLKTIGLNGFDEATIEETTKFSNCLANVKDELYLRYYYPKKGADTLYLKLDKKQGKILIVHNPNVIIDELSPEFKMCSYYGVQDIDEEIDVYNKAASFGFVSVSTAEERRGYLDKFDPTMRE